MFAWLFAQATTVPGPGVQNETKEWLKAFADRLGSDPPRLAWSLGIGLLIFLVLVYLAKGLLKLSAIPAGVGAMWMMWNVFNTGTRIFGDGVHQETLIEGKFPVHNIWDLLTGWQLVWTIVSVAIGLFLYFVMKANLKGVWLLFRVIAAVGIVIGVLFIVVIIRAS